MLVDTVDKLPFWCLDSDIHVYGSRGKLVLEGMSLKSASTSMDGSEVERQYT